jgi:hypothetical protein
MQPQYRAVVRRNVARSRGAIDARTLPGRYFASEWRRLSALIGGARSASERAAIDRAAELSLTAWVARRSGARLDDIVRAERLARSAERELVERYSRARREAPSALERLARGDG